MRRTLVMRNYKVRTQREVSMKISLIRIGNSRGVRIPKAVVEQCGLTDEVEMTVRANSIVISAAKTVREGRDEAFRRMAAAGDDELLLPDDLASKWDKAEWKW